MRVQPAKDKLRVDGSYKSIKMAGKLFGIEFICGFLGFCHIRNIGEGIVVTLVRWLDETYYSMMLRDRIPNADGANPRGGGAKNKICIGVATNKKNTVIIAEGF